MPDQTEKNPPPKRSLRKYKFVRSRDDAILARAETDWVYMGLQHSLPRRIPPELEAAFVIVSREDEP